MTSSFRKTVWNNYVCGSDLLVYLAIWLASTIFIGQDRIVENGSFGYWLAIVPALLFPLIRLQATLACLFFGVGRPIAIFGFFGILWLAAHGDYRPAASLFLIVWVAAWVCRSELKLKVRHLFFLVLGFYAVGIITFLFQAPFENYSWAMNQPAESRAAIDLPSEADPTPLLPDQLREGLDLNWWGVLPGQTAAAFGHWRVSVTPKIATSGLFSLFVLLIYLRKPKLDWLRSLTGTASLYFSVLSFIRAIFSSLILFSISNAFQRILPNIPAIRITAAFVVTIGLVIAVWMAPYPLYELQDYGFISRLFLRGQSGLSVDDIYRQLYRPWLWTQHVQIFWDSNYLMGVGGDLAQSAKTDLINANEARSDADSFLTRLLATYGLPTFGLFYFFARRCYFHARANDIWAISMLSVLIWLMLTWGSSFHPSNGIFALAFLIIGKGSDAFSDSE